MTSTVWTSAPAGLGERGVDVRPYPGVVVCPVVDPLRGTGLPAGGSAVEARGAVRADGARLRPLHVPVAVRTDADAPAAQTFIVRQSTQDDGTTLGIHSPGRPQS